ncbi:MAG: UbiA family prenyltransferase [Sediminibacterium sp.]|nr:UbiA family prenyltransferase [Sediminibacterium sp.]
MPIYWFALSQVNGIYWQNAVLVFVILHVLVYPASNGYNSYMDKDKTAIGGLEQPMQPTRQLFFVTVVMDSLAVLLSLLVSNYFSIGVLLYILVSRAYSYRGIRLKQYPFIGFLTVVIFQGGVTYWLVYHGCSETLTNSVPWPTILAASCLIGGFYPLTQIYQHEADKADGVTTISYVLGYRGTFIFTAIIYIVSFGLLAYWFVSSLQITGFVLLQLFFIPTLLYFFYWANKVWKDSAAANFKHTMQMNLIASVCTNLAFITILILNLFE